MAQSPAPSSILSTSDRSNKRKAPPESKGAQHGNKRHQVNNPRREIRAIPVQPALKDGELNVQAFVNSMAFEINALDESMRRSRTSSSRRAFQRVPFTMRRRTAAHNFKRVPKRLQRRAKREMTMDNTPTVNSKTRKPKTTRSRLRAETARKLGLLATRKRKLREAKGRESNTDQDAKEAITTRAARPKIRRNVPNDLPVTAPRYRKRQQNKAWLPTHLWHAKRARMSVPSDPLWGFTIPLTPTQKNYRVNHRAQWKKGAVAWDMSYMSTIGLYGVETSLKHVLRDLGLMQESLWNDRGKRWRAGAVHWSGNIRPVGEKTRFVGPATIIWNPQDETTEGDANAPTRQIMIRIHPSTFRETFDALLKLIKAYKPRPYLQDLRHEIGSIDITGPDATEALLGVLKPFGEDSEGPHASRFNALLGLRDPASLPLGSLMSFSISDPRLTYPPRKVEPPKTTTQNTRQALLHDAISSFRKDDQLKPYALFDRDIRFKASKLPSQKSVNRRRSKLAPGMALEPSADADPPIPVILLACRNSTDANDIPGTWTLLLPWKCVSAVWNNLMHYPLSTGGNPSFGGLDEIRQLEFERGKPWFPGDVPGTAAGEAWEIRERAVRQRKWERRPKSKRINWDTVDLGAGRKGEVGLGWGCDFETLFGLDSTSSSDSKEKRPDKDQMVVDPVEEDQDKMDTYDSAKESTQNAQPKSPLTTITHLPKNVFNTLISSDPTGGSLPPNSVVTVKIRMLGRGTVTSCARIYRLPTSDSTPVPTVAAKAAATVPSVTVSTQAEVPATVPPSQTSSSNPNANSNPKSIAKSTSLPSDLRSQWLAQLRNRQTPNSDSNSRANSKSALSVVRTQQDRIQALAQSLLTSSSSSSSSSSSALNNNNNTTTTTTHDATNENNSDTTILEDIILKANTLVDASNNQHPPCPDAKDLIGFVTAQGGFNLRHGRGEAIGSIAASFAASETSRYRQNKKKIEAKAKDKDRNKGNGKGDVKGKGHIQTTSKKKGKGKGKGRDGEEEGGRGNEEEEGDETFRFPLVVVRDAGMGVGWLARWELV